MSKKIVAAFLAALMLCDGSVAYATKKVITAPEPEEVLVEEPEINAAEGSGAIDGALYWSVKNNVLTITNQGSSRDIPDYDTEELPKWSYLRNSIRQVVIESGITGIGEYAFYDMPALKKVIINSNQLTSIGEHAFDKCKSLEEINLPNTLNDMGIYAFARCTSLNKISTNGFVTPEALTEIPEYAFAECGGLTEVTFAKNVKSIGASAFYNCGSLKTMNFQGNSIATIEEYAFAKSGLESVVIPDGIQTIQEYVFANCNSLRSFGIRAENSLNAIGTGVFSGCSNITGFYVMAGSYAETYAKSQQNLAGVCKTYKYMSNDRKNNYNIEVIGNTIYTGKEVKPKVTITLNDTLLQEGVDYTLSYSNNVQVGSDAKITITGINEYYGSMDEYFNISTLDITKEGKINNIKNQIYTGKEVKPDVTVTMNGVTLQQDKDYTVSYQNNVKVGNKAKVIITGKGSYNGKIEKYFTITANLSKAKITVKKQTYTGKKLKPEVTVLFNGMKLVEGTDYKVSYSNNKKIGKNAKIAVNGIGIYSGSVSKKFTIAPPKPKVKVSGKKMKITNYQKGADVYITYTANVNGRKKNGKLLWQAKKYKAKKCVDLTQLVKKYKGAKITIKVTMKVNSVESASSKKVTVK